MQRLSVVQILDSWTLHFGRKVRQDGNRGAMSRSIKACHCQRPGASRMPAQA